ncbi:type IV pilus assembly protein PilW [Sulfurifustis variabilis]|uniref:Type IV pilus assembly protein PilW n=1 Tax=Sulfurifustis variabilis TaxID=1675686 RepID=A0A1B4V2G3_9GAMM|nr:PilW family protein [Sulfurifustis variabilis]BAU47703.1 type IV pilus assembly protein PilW [Sulfurifustis variabilis]
MRTPLRNMHGVNLVELMVAMTIGLLILAAVSTLLLDSKRSYVMQDGMARLQENARHAMQTIMRDLRMAGYYGCADEITSVTNTLNGSSGGEAFDVSNPIQGSDDRSNWYPLASPAVPPPTDMLAGTDAIAIRYLDPNTEVDVDEPFMPTTSAALHTSGSGLKVGEIVFVNDCSAGALFQITGPGNMGDAVTGTVVHNTGSDGDSKVPGNSTKNLGKIFEDDAKIAKYYYALYYVKESEVSGQPALHRITLITEGDEVKTKEYELVEGIEDLQLLYGEDTVNGDRVPDVYRKANEVTNWSNVVSARIGLVARSLAHTDSGSKEYRPFIDTTPGYDVDGDGEYDPNYDDGPKNDNYQRRVFRTTVVLRNLQ